MQGLSYGLLKSIEDDMKKSETPQERRERKFREESLKRERNERQKREEEERYEREEIARQDREAKATISESDRLMEEMNAQNEQFGRLKKEEKKLFLTDFCLLFIGLNLNNII